MKMILKIKIKQKKKANINSMEVWIQRNKELDQDLAQIFQFFENQLIYKEIRRILPYFKITSENPAMLFSLITTLQELIAEIFFNNDNKVKLNEELPL